MSSFTARHPGRVAAGRPDANEWIFSWSWLASTYEYVGAPVATDYAAVAGGFGDWGVFWQSRNCCDKRRVRITGSRLVGSFVLNYLHLGDTLSCVVSSRLLILATSPAAKYNHTP